MHTSLSTQLDRVVVPRVIEQIPKGVLGNLVATLWTSEIKEPQVREYAMEIFRWFPFYVVSKNYDYEFDPD